LSTSIEPTPVIYEADGKKQAAAGTAACFIFAHGAGAGQHSTFIVEFARRLASLGLTIATFDFPYIIARRRIPDRGPVLEACYRAVIDAVTRDVPAAREALFIGGKSMGGRIATQVVAADAELPVRGLVLLGYPLHPPGRFDRLRDAHLPAVHRHTLFIQGSRDAFGTPPELEPVLARMSPTPTLRVIDGGDHSFKLPRRDPAAQEALHAEIQRAIVQWIRSVTR
jgi:predicted alpha/beta-hydrolase family hydrolase